MDTIRHYCQTVKDDRDDVKILHHLKGEVKELDIEICNKINNYKEGEDGIVGESIDVILCAFDLIFQQYPGITNEEIYDFALHKLEKWKRKTEAGEYK